MIHIENILVPVDFSEPSNKAVKYGLSLALQFKATLILTHIVPDYRILDYSFPAETFKVDKESLAQAEKRMPDLIPAEFRDKVATEIVVKAGDIQDAILALVADR